MHLKPIMRVGGYFEEGFYLFILRGRVPVRYLPLLERSAVVSAVFYDSVK